MCDSPTGKLNSAFQGELPGELLGSDPNHANPKRKPGNPAKSGLACASDWCFNGGPKKSNSQPFSSRISPWETSGAKQGHTFGTLVSFGAPAPRGL
jgi:hypothetical protein